jgi:hypothetical protein
MSKVNDSAELNLHLGDIIKIVAPQNTDLNNNIYYIQYLDSNIIKLLDVNTSKNIDLNVTEGELDDKAIEGIEILSKSDEKGYSRQNGLLPDTWISITFGGDIPAIINGEITNLDQDMIELTTWPDKEKIYIDFAYKGIPLNLPIISIEPFKNPNKLTESSPVSLEGKDGVTRDLEKDDDEEDGEEGKEYITEEHLNKDMELEKEIYQQQQDTSLLEERKADILDADDIEFGESLEEVQEYIEVSESERRFSLKTQTNDLLDDLLSNMPSSERTKDNLNSLHRLIERFQELREKFSTIDSDGVVKAPLKSEINYKPIVESLDKLNKNIKWLLPITKNDKIIYDFDIDEEDLDDGLYQTTLSSVTNSMKEIIDQYRENTIPNGENKYTYLTKNLNPYLIPYKLNNLQSDIITTKTVHSNIETITDNIDDFYSNVLSGSLTNEYSTKKGTNIQLSKERFIFDKYVKALHVPNSQGDNVNIFNPEKMNITGFLKFPKAVIEYSNINLPQTSIYKKALLDKIFLNYRRLLKSNEIKQHEINEDDLDMDISLLGDDNNLSDMEAFMFKQNKSLDQRDGYEYEKFLNKIIPTPLKIFESVKNDIPLPVTYETIINYLQPYMIYSDDITYKLYETIVNWMKEQILNYKKQIVIQNKEFNKFINFRYNYDVELKKSYLFNILKDNVNEEVIGEYKLKKETTNEFIRRILTLDLGVLFMNAMALDDSDLMVSLDVENTIKKRISEIEDAETKLSSESNSECKNLVIAKQYMDIDELREDNGNESVYFDPKYDETRYNIIDEFKQQQDSMEPTEFNSFLIDHLITNVGLTKETAIKEADAMVNKKRLITEGDYAFFTDFDDINKYYRRDDNDMWIHDEEMDGLALSNDIFCNLKKSCLNINKECNSMVINKEKIKKQLINEMLEEFENENNISNEELINQLTEKLKYNILRVNKLNKLYNINLNKYDVVKFTIGQMSSTEPINTSEYGELRDLILSQSDIAEKYSNILKFIEKTCRPASLSDNEDQAWFYCVNSSTKLLPTFYENLARAYFSQIYVQELEKICAERGEISDDGDKVVDKFSGYLIKNIEFDAAEGYDESGYKIVSRELLQEDVGDMLIKSNSKTSKLLSSRSLMIRNILLTLCKQMDVDILSEFDFIIHNVEIILDKKIPSEDEFNRKKKILLKKGKKLGSYINIHNEALIFLTLGFFLVITQTIIPGVKTSLTFRGCGPKSFSGYPLQGEGDYSALKYLTCTALKLRSKTEPWDRLPKLTREKGIETLKKTMEKVKKIVDTDILTLDDVQEKIIEKQNYNPDDNEEKISSEFNVTNWITFLPPLVPIKVIQYEALGDSFKKHIHENILSGNNQQFEQISILKGKIRNLSLQLQGKIHTAVGKAVLLLENINNDLMVQNSCCYEGNHNTLQYFEEKEKGIFEINRKVIELEYFKDSIVLLDIPYYITDPLDTKFKYPTVSKTFSEEIIYGAFIKYCRFNSGLIIDDKYSAICGKNSSNFKDGDDIKTKIDVLKSEGKDYNLQNFIQLMDVINKENIVRIDMGINSSNVLLNFRNYISNQTILQEIKDTPFMEFFDSLKHHVDKKTMFVKNNNDSKLFIFLKEQIELLSDSITRNLSISKNFNKINDFLDTIDIWKMRGENIYINNSDETSFAYNTYISSFINKLLTLYPNIIENEIDFSNIGIPDHWTSGSQRISNTHVSDIKDIILNEYLLFKKYYGSEELKIVISNLKFNPLVKIIIEITKLLPFIADISVSQDEKLETIFNGKITKLLMTYLFLTTINIYIGEIDNITKKNRSKLSEEKVSSVDEQILMGKKVAIEGEVSNLLVDVLTLMKTSKKILNVTNNEINQDILKSKEKEKSKITKRLGDLSVDERRIEDTMKNHRLGEWAVGQTKSLYVYDENQYDKERKDMEEDALNEIRMGSLDDVSERNREIYKMDYLEELRVNNDINRELNSDIMAIADDDDYEGDGDETGFSAWTAPSD